MISDEELLEEIRCLASDGKPPTAPKMSEDGEYSLSAFRNHFGNWNAAVQAAGFKVNKIGKRNKTELLQEIRQHTDGGRAPTAVEFSRAANTSDTTIIEHFDSWWKAVVRAGLVPEERFPLYGSQFPQFQKAAMNRDRPVESFAGLLLLFTGLPPSIIPRIEQSWFDYLSDSRYSTTLTVPSDLLNSNDTDEWTIKLPATYTVGETTRDTQLPELAQWFFAESSHLSFPAPRNIRSIPYRIAKDAEISRRSVNHSHIGQSPDVAPPDLRASAGVQMARNGAPKRRIRRHLGIEHTGWQADVEGFFLWLYVHEGITHNQYDPPDVVLDPVDPDSPVE